jgi:zinc-finger-containing domain
MPDVICAECGSVMILRSTSKFKYRNGQPRKFYGCSRWPKCNGVHGAHPDGRPFGLPADKPTKAARHAAHVALEELAAELFPRVQGNRRTSRLYGWLSRRMGIPSEECHIGRFDQARCAEVIRLVHSTLELRARVAADRQ